MLRNYFPPPASHKTEAKSLFHTLEAAVCAARPSIEGGKPSISSAFVMSFSNCFVASNTFSLNFVESSINSCSGRYQSQTTTRNSGPNLLLLMILQLLFQWSLALTAAPLSEAYPEWPALFSSYTVLCFRAIMIYITPSGFQACSH